MLFPRLMNSTKAKRNQGLTNLETLCVGYSYSELLKRLKLFEFVIHEKHVLMLTIPSKKDFRRHILYDQVSRTA